MHARKARFAKTRVGFNCSGRGVLARVVELFCLTKQWSFGLGAHDYIR